MNINKELPRYYNKNWCKYKRVPTSKTGGNSDCNIKLLWFQYYKLYVTGYDKGDTNEKIVIDEEIEMIMSKNNDNGDNKDKKGDNEMKGIDNKYHQETLTVNNDNVDDKCAKGNNINEKIDVIENISNNKTCSR